MHKHLSTVERKLFLRIDVTMTLILGYMTPDISNSWVPFVSDDAFEGRLLIESVYQAEMETISAEF